MILGRGLVTLAPIMDVHVCTCTYTTGIQGIVGARSRSPQLSFLLTTDESESTCALELANYSVCIKCPSCSIDNSYMHHCRNTEIMFVGQNK